MTASPLLRVTPPDPLFPLPVEISILPLTPAKECPVVRVMDPPVDKSLAPLRKTISPPRLESLLPDSNTTAPPSSAALPDMKCMPPLRFRLSPLSKTTLPDACCFDIPVVRENVPDAVEPDGVPKTIFPLLLLELPPLKTLIEPPVAETLLPLETVTEPPM